jgi:uncharacterized membrane protein required for colicin V production
MVWYDFVILAILVYGVWQGAARGLVMQLAWIIAIVACFQFADKLAPQIESHISVEPPLRHWIAMFILYLGFSLGSFLVARSLSNAIEKAKLKDFDRHLGGLFGLVKGVVLSLVLTFFAVTLSESLQETVVRSRTGHIACLILDAIKPLTPEDAHPLITDSLKKYETALQQVHDEHQGIEASPENILKDLLGGHDDSTANHLDDDFGVSAGGSRRETSLGSSYDALLNVLPNSVRDQMSRGSYRDRWEQLSSDERDEWVTDLKYATDAQTPRLLERLYSSFGGEGRGLETQVDPRLVERIAAEYSEYDDPQLVIVRIREYLKGLSEPIQTAVLEDWYADLDTTGSQRDPDTRTDGDTRIDDRILNQLSRAGVRIDQLADNDLQARLLRSR